MLVTSRCLEEYEAMFDLHAEDLDGVVVDCAAGASSFAAETADRARTVLAVDPAYAQGAHALSAAALASIDSGNSIIDQHPDRFVWDWYGTPERRSELRGRAVSRFLDDLGRHPQRYVAAGLPRLPLRDRSVDLLLCSHLLFTWSDQLNLEWHRAALAEMLRVTQGEVRIFPLVVQGTGEPVPYLGEVAAEIRRTGLDVQLRNVPYEFQKDAHSMLAISRRT